jgi:hypothetical protein
MKQPKLKHRPAAARFWRLPPQLEKTGSLLMDCQMWCLGRDICHTQGNLLIQYGCERRPAPEGRQKSAYVLAHSSGIQLIFWGFGIFCAIGELGGVYINRYHFRPQYSPYGSIPDAWSAAELPECRAPITSTERAAAAGMLAQIVEALYHYEMWVLDRYGTAYREKVIWAHPNHSKHSPQQGADLKLGWHALAQQIAAVESNKSDLKPDTI